jgi:hypothetical protein
MSLKTFLSGSSQLDIDLPANWNPWQGDIFQELVPLIDLQSILLGLPVKAVEAEKSSLIRKGPSLDGATLNQPGLNADGGVAGSPLDHPREKQRRLTQGCCRPEEQKCQGNG